MNSALKLMGIALISIVLLSGLGAAAGIGGGFADAGMNAAATQADRPMDGSNSHWVIGDDRLERFQDRFDLTDDQMAEIRTAVLEAFEDGADRAAIRDIVTAKLEAFGIDDPELGPSDGQRYGPKGPNTNPDGQAHRHGGQGPGNGPHGPADGSCLTG